MSSLHDRTGERGAAAGVRSGLGPDVGAVLVEFNSGGLTARAAEAALALGLTVAVADNSGTYRGVGEVVRTAGNIGFGAACNAAVRLLPPHVHTVVLWNPDARIDGRDLEALVAAVHEQGWAAVAPLIDADPVRPCGFAYPNLLREALVTAREVLWCRGARIRSGAPSSASAGSVQGPIPRSRRFGSAAILVLDRSAFDNIGGFDEKYFLYVEDLDLWDRLVAGGGRCGFLPSARAEHDAASGSDAPAARRALLRWTGVETFVAARHRIRWIPYRVIHRLGLRFLLSDGDGIVEEVRRTSWMCAPAQVQARIRQIALGRRATYSAQTRLGWARTRVSLAETDRVLDVGSGAFPNPRADVLCERSPIRRHRIAVVDRPFVVADALALPFRDNAFDFVIASHLAEHVEDPVALCHELDRVARAGYVETPSPLFERLFPERNHLWRVHRRGTARLRFERNRPSNGVLRRLGQAVYPWYYAGVEKDEPTFRSPSLAGRLVVRSAFVVRGAANRLGITVTRCHFGGADRLRGEVIGEAS